MRRPFSQPFAVRVHDVFRRFSLAEVAAAAYGCNAQTVKVFRDEEPHPFWTEDTLRLRAMCYAYANLGDLAEQASRDLDRFREADVARVVTPPDRRGPGGSF